ncbi:MAG: alanine--tRNA ligase [Holosporales bacterium]|jgi:alanyl-tRNA synthetase|nr:alanine--tRNA ligase [Holosporales bacterium]
MKTQEIRRLFLSFFDKNCHKIVPSSALVPEGDPTLLFVNAGMVQFKDIFTGVKARPYPKATTVQKCLRAGGKHNDLDQVGYTARHHSFFEMLGNFSFGEYFKEEAIRLAWTFLTQELHLPKDRLCVTIFHEDTEAAALWAKIAGITPIPITTTDNFWSMGDTGPCGPCSEIFYDHGAHIPGGPPGSPDENGDRFVEIWNLVFMQFEQQANGERTLLPKPSIDTGMGLERVAAVMQGVTDNYDTDLFKMLRTTLEEIVGRNETPETKASFKVIADHLRAAAFLCAEGVAPGSDGRSYVLRRIIRRAVRHGHFLGLKEPFFHRLIPTLVHEMGADYPELCAAEPHVKKTLKQEEERFRETLERGLLLLDEETNKLSTKQVFPGEVAFKLYDTYGFPLDLTETILGARGITIDKEAFEAALEEQRTRSQWAGSGDKRESPAIKTLLAHLPTTFFCGYSEVESSASIIGLIRREEGVQCAVTGEDVILILDKTPFYAASGGQQADQGEICSQNPGNAVVTIKEVRKTTEGVFLHVGRVVSGSITVGDVVIARIDQDRRCAIAVHHSATHLLQAALRAVLGSHVAQKGSFVDADRLRFDFSHTGPLSDENLETIERLVNQWIRESHSVNVSEQDKNAAIESGAIALFGEKYQDIVRVVRIEPHSVELCGGTHVTSTGNIGFFHILTETGIGSGVRRIEAVAGAAACRYVEALCRTVADSAKLLNTSEENLSTVIATIQSDIEHLRHDNRRFQAERAFSMNILEERIGPVTLLCQKVSSIEPREIRNHVDTLKKTTQARIVVILSEDQEQTRVYVGVSEDLKKDHPATRYLEAITAGLQEAGGGGRSDFAQGGGKGVLNSKGVLLSIKQIYKQQ